MSEQSNYPRIELRNEAQRIVELEEQLEKAQQKNERLKEAEHVKGYWLREGMIEQLREQNQKLIAALKEIQGTLYGDVMDRMQTMMRIADKAIMEVQHGTSKE